MRRITITLLIALLLPQAMAGADAKFFKKASDRVWSMRPDLFDPHREIPDSIKEGTSAVIIGEYNYLKGDYKAINRETQSESECFTRRMVKLLDNKAVEEFSKHEFGESASLGFAFRRNLAETDHAFGARIHKPDRTIVDVDLSNSFLLDEGKKGGKKENSSRIIDIPGLEVGDVLEYFSYRRSMVREFDLPVQRLKLMADYPVLDEVVEGVFSPELTVEFRGYNGVPLLEEGKDKSGNNTVWIEFSNLPVQTDKRFVNAVREEPFYNFYILNNTSSYRFYPRSARNGGLYQNPAVGTVFSDIAFSLAGADFESSPLCGKIRKIVKDYKKNNPGATSKQLLDAAWVAANYVNLTDIKNGGVSDFLLALIASDVMQKEKLAEKVDVAFITPVTDVATDELLHWNQPDFGVEADGNLYLVESIESYLPGELPAEYQGQMCAAYPGKRSDEFKFTPPSISTTPTSKWSDNKIVINSVLSLGDDHDAAVTNEVICSGAAKVLSEGFISSDEWIDAQASYLGIQDVHKPTSKHDETEKKRLENTEKLYSGIFAGADSEVSNVKVSSLGIVPGQPDFRMTFDSKVNEITTDAGDEVIVKIGELVGDNKRIEGTQRARMCDITFRSAYQEDYSITVKVPEGYEVDEAAIEALSRNVQTPAGIFVTRAKKGDGGRSVVLDVRSRIQRPKMSIAAWPYILELTDAKADFSDAIIIFKKK